MYYEEWSKSRELARTFRSNLGAGDYLETEAKVCEQKDTTFTR